MANAATFDTREYDGLWLIGISGELTKMEEPSFQEVHPWTKEHVSAKDILFNLSKLDYINSAGIALLIRFVREAHKRGYRASAYGVSPHYQKIFRIVGLTTYIEIFPDEYSAIETLQTRREYDGM